MRYNLEFRRTTYCIWNSIDAKIVLALGKKSKERDIMITSLNKDFFYNPKKRNVYKVELYLFEKSTRKFKSRRLTIFVQVMQFKSL